MRPQLLSLIWQRSYSAHLLRLPWRKRRAGKPQRGKDGALPEVLRGAKGGAEQQKVAYDTARSI